MKNVFTIGFTEKTAKEFFSLLKKSGTRRLIDVRLNNTSQLAGFSKREDLRFFLKEICNIDYLELPDFYPEAIMLKDYRNKLISWDQYESKYIELLAKRSVEKKIDFDLLDDGCLLCSEHKPHYCHRRIALEYLNSCSEKKLSVKHLY